MKLGTLSIMATGAALLAAAIWFSRSSSPGLLPESTPQVNQPNSYALLQSTQSKHYNHEGKLAYSYKAASMEYFRPAISPTHEQDYSLVQLPQLTFFGEGLPWFINAKEGKITDQGDTLEVWGDVRVWQVNAEGKQTLLTTQSLKIKPRMQEISTLDAVAIQGPTGSMGAQGLTVNLDTQILKLHSRVKGTHAPVRTR
ncbi:MAG TPA: LPS export ABC transporter periplasmic protein LptC [Cellvibrionaceae bacterium]